MRKKWFALRGHIRASTMVVAIAVMMSVFPSAAQAAVINGGFETGTFSGWTVVPGDAGSDLTVRNNFANSGDYAAWFGSRGVVDDTIWQTVTTLPGVFYEVDFWLAHLYTNTVPDLNGFDVWVNGTSALHMVDATGFEYSYFSLPFTGTGSDTIAFGGRENPSYYLLDDVNVSIANPEPASLILLVTGLAATGLRRRFSWKRAV